METDSSVTLAEDEVVRRKSYLEITPEDEARLREAHHLIQVQAPQIIARFYDYLLDHEPMRRMVGQKEHVDLRGEILIPGPHRPEERACATGSRSLDSIRPFWRFGFGSSPP
jgi:hypothetical protein